MNQTDYEQVLASYKKQRGNENDSIADIQTLISKAEYVKALKLILESLKHFGSYH